MELSESGQKRGPTGSLAIYWQDRAPTLSMGRKLADSSGDGRMTKPSPIAMKHAIAQMIQVVRRSSLNRSVRAATPEKISRMPFTRMRDHMRAFTPEEAAHIWAMEKDDDGRRR